MTMVRWPKTKYGKKYGSKYCSKVSLRKCVRFMKKTKILLSQKYGKGDRKFAEIQGTDLTLGAVGSDKILKENPI